MRTLCIDTSHRHLVIVLVEDGKEIVSFVQEAWKKQSETIFVELIELMEKAQWEVDMINAMVITKGPGSYTGTRIAMAVAKVLCTTKKIRLYTISTLQLYAGLANTYVLLDARSQRAYFGNYQNGKKIEEGIKTIAELQSMKDKQFIGDTDLLGIEKRAVDFSSHFIALQPFYELVENVHTLIPEYLKEESAYLVK